MALLATSLSAKGLEKATTIMSLEQVLFEMEGPNGKMKRDPELYYFSIFGTPDAKGTWGWRVEGHHISLNLTIAAARRSPRRPPSSAATRRGEERAAQGRPRPRQRRGDGPRDREVDDRRAEGRRDLDEGRARRR
jgi:hypothetical protein